MVFFGLLFGLYLPYDFSSWVEVDAVFWMPTWSFAVLRLPMLDADALRVLQAIWKVALACACIGLATRAELCVPVCHHDKIVAVLNLESTRAGAFQGQLPVLQGVADPIAGAVASAQLYADLQRVTAQLEQTTRALADANAHLGRAIETLHRISTEDGLTQLSNRRHFDDTLALEWRRAARHGTPLSLLMLDLDYFKIFNDERGHQAGDEALREDSHVLRDSVHRAADVVARYGGEEFVVLLPETDATRARDIAELPRRKIEELGSITASVGVASEVPSRDNTAETLVKRADQALYEAKRLGRNRVA
jgi:diguanylate cyclase (GGDEF)-like protein